MDFSLQLLPEQPLAQLIDVVRLADGLGFRACYSAERLSIAGEPAEWIERLRRDFAPHGYDHVALGLVDPTLIQSWSGRRIDGVPDLAAQLELFAAHVVPALTDA